ncbi:GyrI-like domain-containing protein [Agrococcus sp. TSP3-2-1]|uniref:GyrI-like domain-containing protein n=1 Tax=Agrococcus sp. TSP3-2-1 TaxID=2804583 RepID=UPI003CE947B5
MGSSPTGPTAVVEEDDREDRPRAGAGRIPREAGRDAVADVRLERLDEGRCAQPLHVGAFDDEGPVLARIHDESLPAEGLRPRGRHHEIYLGDARRAEAADDPPPARRARLRARRRPRSSRSTRSPRAPRRS